MIAYYVHNLSPFVFRFTDRIAVHWYGLAYVMGFYLAYVVMKHLAKRGLSVIRPEQVADFITFAAIFGVVLGGRLGYMLLYDFDNFIHRPWSLFLINQGGMASHGGIAGLALFCLWFARKHKISWTGLGDTLVCGAPLGIFFGRIANFINGELFGHITTVPWAVKFPTEIHHEDFYAHLPPAAEGIPFERFPQHSQEILAFYKENYGDPQQLIDMLHPRHPSQLYEALGEGALLFAALFIIRIKFPRLPHGVLTALFFLLYAVARIALENVRQPDSGANPILGLTRGQFFSTFMIVIGLAFLAYALWKPQRLPLAEESPQKS